MFDFTFIFEDSANKLTVGKHDLCQVHQKNLPGINVETTVPEHYRFKLYHLDPLDAQQLMF